MTQPTHIFAVLLLSLLAAACTTAPPRDTPAPVEERGSASPYVPPEQRVIPLPRGERAPVAPAPSPPAVVALLQSAAEQQRAGQLDAAASTLERALRIEPDNAMLWYRLGRVRLEQRRWSQAEQLAQKSLRLAGGNTDLRVDNWDLIAAARRGAGDLTGSREAEREAQRLR